MAQKTSVFYLTERLTMPTTATQYTDTIDLGAYVDVADRQGILVHSCDFIFQGTDPEERLATTFGAASNAKLQITDLNRGDLVFADDRALVASGEIVYTPDGGFDNTSDLYPDNFGPTSAQGGRIVINDQLYVRGYVGAVAAGKAINATVRLKVSVINLSQKDFMAIALQSTAADN